MNFVTQDSFLVERDHVGVIIGDATKICAQWEGENFSLGAMSRVNFCVA